MKIFIMLLFSLLVLFSFGYGQNFYLGNGYSGSDGTCSNVGCHAGTIASWEQTRHAHAQADGMTNPFFGYSCLQCHNTGWDLQTDNWGADEYVDSLASNGFLITDSLNWNRVENVQCETCHGAVGTADSTIDFSHVARETNLSAELCGACHEGSHHPTYENWQESAHATSLEAAGGMVKSNRSCAGCHTVTGFIQYLEQDPFSEPDVDPPGDAAQPINCIACHNPHDKTNDHQLRDEKVAFCDRCHNPEYSPDSPVPDGSALHHTTAFMFDGKGGYEYPGVSYENSPHSNAVVERCVTCHVFKTEFQSGPPEVAAYTGHSFEPQPGACETCHDDFDFTALDSTFDYEGVQTEITGLLAELEAKLAAASPEDSLTDAWLQAKFNWEFVNGEGSHGIHNTKYARGLLQSSIDNFEPTAVEPIQTGLPLAYALKQNYPNPFNPTTDIEFSITKSDRVVLKVYDLLGQEIATLIDKNMTAGVYKTRFEGINLAAGVYIYQIVAGDFTAVKKMVLLK